MADFKGKGYEKLMALAGHLVGLYSDRNGFYFNLILSVGSEERTYNFDYFGGGTPSLLRTDEHEDTDKEPSEIINDHNWRVQYWVPDDYKQPHGLEDVEVVRRI